MESDKEKAIKEYLASLGRKGGRKRAETLTERQRQAIAKKGAEARWHKEGDKK